MGLKLKLLVVSVAMVFPGRVQADTNLNCVFSDLNPGEVCPVFSAARSMEFLDVGDDAVIFIDSVKIAKTSVERSERTSVEPRERTSVVVSSRIEEIVANSGMDEDDGLLLADEIQELAGARYELPTSRREITKQLGLPDNAEFDDWTEMLRVHAEMVLSISPAASRFLLDQVGVVAAANQPASAQQPAAAPPSEAATVESVSDPVVVETH